MEEHWGKTRAWGEWSVVKEEKKKRETLEGVED